MAHESHSDALCKINQVLYKVKDCSSELNEVESIVTELKTAAHSSSDDFEARPDLLIVACTVRDMLDVLKTGLQKLSDVQKLRVATQRVSVIEDRASEEDNMGPKRARLITQAEASNVCGNSSTETRVAAWKGPQVCTHTCFHHPEIVNPGLWSKLTEDLVGLVFARLPIPRIIGLRKCSEAWSAMSNSSSFKEAFGEANPKLFGLLGWDGDLENFRTRILEVTSKQWHGVELDFPKGNGYMDSWYACDGGLVCFVPEWEDDECLDPIFVCNPLTNSWRELPDIPFGFKDPVLVQLVTDGDTKCYRVILVYSEKLKSQDVQTFGAFLYDSKTGSWSMMNSGLVYGTGNTLLGDRNDPLLFDCATKRLFNLDSCLALQDLMALRYSILKDHLFVLHALINPDSPGDSSETFVISEFTWESSTSDLRKLTDYEVILRGLDFGSYVGRQEVEIFTSSGFILSTWDNLSENGSIRQLIRLYDISAHHWRELPPLVGDPDIRNEKLEGVFMCELRWDAIP